MTALADGGLLKATTSKPEYDLPAPVARQAKPAPEPKSKNTPPPDPTNVLVPRVNGQKSPSSKPYLLFLQISLRLFLRAAETCDN